MRGLVIALAAGLSSVALPTGAQRPAPRAAMLSSARWMHSRMVGDSFAIHVAVPARYDVDTTRRFGVLYVVDGDKSFGLARDVVDWLSWPGANEVVPLIVVGIGYGGLEATWWQKRARDLTPTKDRSRVWGDWPLAGAAEAFHTFLADELIPAIDREYRTLTSPRIVAGLSFGGLFAAWSLLHERATFTAAIAVNPAFAWDSTGFAGPVQARRGKGSLTPLHLYTAVGDRDDDATMQRPWRAITGALREIGAPLRVDTEVLPGETHISSWPVGLAHGLKRVAAPPSRRGRGTQE